MRLEQLHQRSDDVEHEDHFGFAEGLHAKGQQQDLNQQSCQKEEIVTCQPCMVWPEKARAKHQSQQESAKKARPGLLEDEEAKLPEEGCKPAGGLVALQPETEGMETGELGV